MALTLFEWSYRFTETHDTTFTHPADAIVVDRLASELEWELPETRSKTYPKRLQESRRRILADYRSTMGQNYSRWLDKIPYQDSI